MLISLRVLIFRAAVDLQSSLNNSSGHTNPKQRAQIVKNVIHKHNIEQKTFD